MHATIDPQQQLAAAARERRCGVPIDTDLKQLQGVVRLWQRQRCRRTDVRFERHVQRVGIDLQLRLRDLCTCRCAGRCFGQPFAQLLSQCLVGQRLRV
jgi:hypothetical protein